MSTLWTPSGERPVRREPPEPTPARPGDAAGRPGTGELGELGDEELAELMAVQHHVLRTPGAALVANHCMSLFELAALYLSPDPPQLADAQVAIDAMAAVVEGLGRRLGEHEKPLREGLSQLRLGFVEAKTMAARSPRPADAGP